MSTTQLAPISELLADALSRLAALVATAPPGPLKGSLEAAHANTRTALKSTKSALARYAEAESDAT